MGFFRNDEKTACDTKISNSLATVQPNDIIVITFRLDVLCASECVVIPSSISSGAVKKKKTTDGY